MDCIKINCTYADTTYEVEFPRNMTKYSTFLDNACGMDSNIDVMEFPLPVQKECWTHIKQFLQLRLDNPERADSMDEIATNLKQQDGLDELDRALVDTIDIMDSTRLADAANKLGIRSIEVIAAKRIAIAVSRENDPAVIDAMFKPKPVEDRPYYHIIP